VALLLAAILVLVMALSVDGPSSPLGAVVAILALLALLALVLPDMESSPPIGTRLVLLEAARDIGDGGDPREIAGLLRDVDVQEGRTRLCLDMAEVPGGGRQVRAAGGEAAPGGGGLGAYVDQGDE
jgi:hypothetical protein